jgi:hypothetical protein
MTNDELQIESLVADYLEALYQCDTGLLENVFHPQAIYATAVESKPLVLSMPEYLPIVAKRDPPARTSAPRIEEIILIDVVGPTTALVKLRCRFFQKDYLDLLTLIKVDGKWSIIAKVFHYDPVRQ